MRWDVGQGIEVTIVPTASVHTSTPLGKDPNNHALVIGVAAPDVWRTVLLSGDVNGPLLNDTLSALGPWLIGDGTQAGLPRGIGFYKVTHHCSETGDDGALLGNLDPDWAATSCALHNKFGHPYTPLKNRLDDSTLTHSGGHLLTYMHGDIIYPDEKSVPCEPATSQGVHDTPKHPSIPPRTVDRGARTPPSQHKLKKASEVLGPIMAAAIPEHYPRRAGARAAYTKHEQPRTGKTPRRKRS
jgi:hypothetical protein